MSINNLPAALQIAIQQNWLERAFQEGLRSKLIYAEIADEEDFPTKVGETVTKTRRGLKIPTTTPINPSTNTNFDNGLTPSEFSLEQYTMTMDMYGDTSNLNDVTSRVNIVPLFMQYQEVNGIQAAQSIDRLCRNAIFNTYNGGNTWVTATLGAPGTTIAVDDIRKFNEIAVNGVMIPVSITHPRQVLVGSAYYNLISVAADVVNTSLLAAQGGISGTLTFSGNVAVIDGTLKNHVVAKYSPVIIRPNARATYTDLISTDTLTLRTLRDAVAVLRNSNVPAFANGRYRLYLDQDTMNGLYLDQQFKEIFYARYQSEEFQEGFIGNISGVDFYLTTEAFQQDYNTGSSILRIHRPILCGSGALIRGNFEGTEQAIAEKQGAGAENVITRLVDNVAYVIRPPMDRLGQIYALSWYTILGFAIPSDTTVTKDIIPTSTESYYKRAVVIECA